jgi:8-oxo-dGTP pyrophosphatase MutT (NUDIX family)
MAAPEPRPSASVILVDPERGGDEPWGLFLLRRAGGSSFMPQRFVFPGGAVEPGDAGDLRTCALRELWEEAGVLLATDPAAAAAAEPAARERARRAVEAGEPLDRALAGLGLEPAPEALAPWRRWVTPRARSRRFDTTFYLARMPAGQEAASDLRETDQGLWLGPAAALAQNQEAGRVSLAPPQVRLLGELAELAASGSLEELWRAARSASLEPVEPVLWREGERRTILLPWDPDHAAGRPVSPDRACAAGRASRLVHRGGRWLPRLAGA